MNEEESKYIMKISGTKYPINYVKADSNISDYEKLKQHISTTVWNNICEYVENLNFSETSDISLKKFYKNDWDSRVGSILRDMNKLSDDVADYILQLKYEKE